MNSYFFEILCSTDDSDIEDDYDEDEVEEIYSDEPDGKL